MDEQRLKTLKALAEGVDPATGEAFPESSPYQRPEVIRCLTAAVAELSLPQAQALPPVPNSGSASFARAGEPWSPEEEQRLLTRFDAGESEAEIARRLDRSKTAIVARLVKLGRIDPPAGLRLRGQAPQAHA